MVFDKGKPKLFVAKEHPQESCYLGECPEKSLAHPREKHRFRGFHILF